MLKLFKSLLYLTSASILLHACSFSDNDEFVEEVNFTRKSFDSISNVNMEVLSFDKPLDPALFYVIKDSLILVRNWQARPYYLAFYNMKNKELMFEFVKRGRGPNEWLSASVSYNSNFDNGFVLRDIHTNEAAIFNIDSLLMFKASYSPQRYKIPDFTKGDIVVIDSCDWLCFNLYHTGFMNFRNKVKSCLYPINVCNNQDFDDEIRENKYFTHNVAGGFIAVSPDKSRILVFYEHLNMIEVFNNNIELIKRLRGPEAFKPELKIIDIETNFVGFDKRTQTFGHCFYNQKFIYVIYKGIDGLEKKMPTEVFKLNWNGDFLHRYILSDGNDIELQNLFIDLKDEYLYGTVSDSKNYPQLVRFKLKNNHYKSEN